jgi:tetratricopeptide (TPR) repeat protein
LLWCIATFVLLSGRVLAVPSGPSDPEELYAKARAAFDDRRFDEALPLFHEVVRHPEGPRVSWARVYIGRCLYELGRPELAARALADALELVREDDTRASAEYWLARSYYRQNCLGAATPLFAEVALQTEHALADNALYFLARCQQRKGHYCRARELYRACLRLYPQSDRADNCEERLTQVAAALERRQRWRPRWEWDTGLIADSNVSRLSDGPSDTIWFARLGLGLERWAGERTRWSIGGRGDRYDYLSLDERDREGYRAELSVRLDLEDVRPLPSDVSLADVPGREWLRSLALPQGTRWYAGVYRFTSQRGDAYDLDYASNRLWTSYYRPVGPRDVLRLGASARLIEYEDQRRSGLRAKGSLGLVHYRPDGVELEVRYEPARQWANERWFGYNEHRLRCEAQTQLGALGKCDLTYEFRLRDFAALDPDLDLVRRDDRHRWRLELARPISRGCELALGAEYRRQNSTSPQHDYSVSLFYSRLAGTF